MYIYNYLKIMEFNIINKLINISNLFKNLLNIKKKI